MESLILILILCSPFTPIFFLIYKIHFAPLILKNQFVEFLENKVSYYFYKKNNVFLNIIFKSVKKDLRLILKKDKEFLSNFNSHYRLKLLEECLNHDINYLKSKK